MKSWVINNLLVIIGSLLGGLAGFLYWKWVGCDSGTCRISSKPLNSTLYFALMGALLFSMFKNSAHKDG